MRLQRWIAATLIAGAVGIGVLGGCGKKTDTTTTTTTDSTSLVTDTTATPAPDTGEVSLAVGERIVKERCVLCHGDGGKGDGPGGAVLNPKPRNWTDHSYMGARTDQELYDVIYNGKGSMPAWGKPGILTPSEIRSALLKVRSFDPQYKAPAGG